MIENALAKNPAPPKPMFDGATPEELRPSI